MILLIVKHTHTNTAERAEITFGDVHFVESMLKVVSYSSIESEMAQFLVTGGVVVAKEWGTA